MRASSRGFVFAVVFAVALSGHTVEAQDTQIAQRDFEAASRAFDRGRFEEALRLFRSAFDAAPRAAVRFNIAVCLERLGRLREAWLEYRAAVAPGELDSAQLERAEREAARLRSLLATLDARGSPEGADVRVDGVSVCTLPCAVEIDPGAHTVSAHAEGRSVERGIHVDSRQTLVLELDVPSPLPRVREVTPRHDEPPRSASVLDDEGETNGGHQLGWLTGIGVTVAAIGVGGIVGFGLHTQSLHDAWLAGGPEDVRAEGLTMRTLTNISIGVATLGVALVLVDLVLTAASGPPPAERRASRAMPLRF